MPRSIQNHTIGIALGSGSARGLANIGVLRELEEVGIRPDLVCGSSIGSLVGAAYVCGQLDDFESWVRGLSIRDILRYMDIKLVVGGGFADGRRLIDYFRERSGDPRIEDLPGSFAAVATDLSTGREVWIQEGPLWDAVRASMALPGLLTPCRQGGRWLVDGGLVNPVPVSVCRALQARTVIAVNLSGDVVGRHLSRRRAIVRKAQRQSAESRLLEKLASSLKSRANNMVSKWLESGDAAPGLFDVLAGSVNIMQDRITRSRLAGEPPDVMFTPRLGHIGLLEFDRAAEAIEEGRASVRRMLPALQHATATEDPGPA